MAETGLDAATWLTILGLFVLFFGLPLGMLEYDRRKRLRQSDQDEPTLDGEALDLDIADAGVQHRDVEARTSSALLRHP